MLKDLDAYMKELSFRARRVLADLSVEDTDTLLKITIDDLLRFRSCGEKTIAEIEALQNKLRDSSSTSQITDVLPEYENIPPDAFEALLGILSHRSRNILETKGGMASLEELTKILLCKGKDGQQLKHATELIKFFAGLKIWQDHGLKLENNVVFFNDSSNFLVQNLTSIFEEVASTYADEKIDERLWSIDCLLLKDSLTKKMATITGGKKTATLSDTVFDAIISKLKNKVKMDKGRVYSLNLWNFRIGSATQALEAALCLIGKPAHYREVYECALKWRPDISGIDAYGILNQSHKALLWDRCVYFHKDHAKIPSDLIQDVENWLLGALKENIPFISITGAFQHFHNLCQRTGISSEVALYSCLIQSDHPELLSPRQPFVYLKKGGAGAIPVPKALENFIRDAGGPVSYQEVKDF